MGNDNASRIKIKIIIKNSLKNPISFSITARNGSGLNGCREYISVRESE